MCCTVLTELHMCSTVCPLSWVLEPGEKSGRQVVL